MTNIAINVNYFFISKRLGARNTPNLLVLEAIFASVDGRFAITEAIACGDGCQNYSVVSSIETTCHCCIKIGDRLS
jgi:hypothetical protein